MIQIKAEEITVQNFAPFGQFYNMAEPEGYALCGELHKFYPDRLTAYHGKNLGFSPITVRKPEKMIIDAVEYHTTTCEIILPLNDDMVLHVAPASAGTPVTPLTKAFIVPKNTLVKMNAAIWHLAPLPVQEKELYAMIILPECTYANDCTVVTLDEEEKFEIVLS